MLRSFLNKKSHFSLKNVLKDINLDEIKNSLHSYKLDADNLYSLADAKLFHFKIPYTGPEPKFCITCHLYYSENLREILLDLRSISIPFKIIITIANEELLKDIINISNLFELNADIYLVENRGRDIKPFIDLIHLEVFDKYNAVLKIHGKYSSYSIYGNNWRQNIFNTLMNAQNIKKILALFNDNRAGLLCRNDDLFVNPFFWGSNYNEVKNLSTKLGIKINKKGLKFFAGSMFWFNPKALKDLKNINQNTIRILHHLPL